MPFKQTIRGRVLYASWRGYTLDDLKQLTGAIGELRRTLDREVIYLSRIPFDNTLFSADDQQVLLDFLLGILPDCASIHHVIEGDGFVKSARRSIVTTMALASPRPRDFHAHSTLAEAAASIGELHGIDLSELVARRSAPPNPNERASGAFRQARRLAGGRRWPTR